MPKEYAQAMESAFVLLAIRSKAGSASWLLPPRVEPSISIVGLIFIIKGIITAETYAAIHTMTIRDTEYNKSNIDQSSIICRKVAKASSSFFSFLVCVLYLPPSADLQRIPNHIDHILLLSFCTVLL